MSEQAPPAFVAALADLVSEGSGERLSIEDLRRLSGGASRETWSFDTVAADGTRSARILRRDFVGDALPDVGELSGTAGDISRHGEYELMATLSGHGLPVPSPVAAPGPESELQDCFVMERIEGESMPRSILRDPLLAGARAGLANELGVVLGRWWALTADDLPPLPLRSHDGELAVCRGLLDRVPRRRPVLELAYRWLVEHPPPTPDRLSLVHGDFRLANFVVGPEGLRSVLDWEYAHLGDPIEDLAFLCLKPWRFGQVDHEVGGFGDRADLVRGFEGMAGIAVDPAAFRFWSVLGQLKWGALCGARAELHLEGVHRSVEVAAIGRRVAETEYDLLELME